MMLSKVVPLNLQVLLYILGHLNEFSYRALSLLSVRAKQWLFFHLPLADVCLLEQFPVFKGLDTNSMWRSLCEVKLLKLRDSTTIAAEKDLQSYTGSWRQFYLHHLWLESFQFLSPSLADVSIAEQSEWEETYLQNKVLAKLSNELLNPADCPSVVTHMFVTHLFAAGITSLIAELSTDNTLFGIHVMKCDKCLFQASIPNCYLPYWSRNEYDHLPFLFTIFWIYCQYKPEVFRVNFGFKTKCSPLTQLVLKLHPDVLCIPLSAVHTLDFSPRCLSPEQSSLLRAVVQGVYNGLEVMKLNISDRNHGKLSKLENLPKRVHKLVVHGRCSNVGIVYIKDILLCYLNQLTEVSLRCLWLNDMTDKVFVTSLCNLFQKSCFQKLSISEGEINFSILRDVMDSFFHSPFEQDMKLENLKIYDYCTNFIQTDKFTLQATPKNLSISFASILEQLECENGSHELQVKDLYHASLQKFCQYIIMAMEWSVFKTLILTGDVLEELYNSFHRFQKQKILKPYNIKTLILDGIIFQSNTSLVLCLFCRTVGISNLCVNFDLYRSDMFWFNDSDVAMQCVYEVMHTLVNVVKIGFSWECQESFQFMRFGHNAYRKDMFKLLFECLFSFPELSEIELDLSRFQHLKKIHVCVIYAVWLEFARGKKLKNIYVEDNVIAFLKEDLLPITDNIKTM